MLWALGGALGIFVLFSDLGAQEAPEKPEEETPINHAKFLAQQAAMPSLKGKNPYLLREAHWQGTIEPGKAKLIQTQLFRRNDYQFWLAVPDRDAEVLFHIYDGQGQLVQTELKNHGGPGVVSTRLVPEASGIYYLRISLRSTAARSQEWVLLYSYR